MSLPTLLTMCRVVLCAVQYMLFCIVPYWLLNGRAGESGRTPLGSFEGTYAGVKPINHSVVDGGHRI